MNVTGLEEAFQTRMNVTESVSANAKSGACHRVGLINEFDKRGLITYKSEWNLINLHLEDCCS